MSPPDAAHKLDKMVKGAKGAVDDAIESLEEMELAFRRDTKKRKLQVESSVISSQDATPDRAFMPRMVRGNSSVLQPSSRLLLTPERDNGDAEDDIGDGVAEEEPEAHDKALEPVDVAAQRAPAVNSDFLPLPWKGRLGYVSHLRSGSSQCAVC